MKRIIIIIIVIMIAIIIVPLSENTFGGKRNDGKNGDYKMIVGVSRVLRGLQVKISIFFSK